MALLLLPWAIWERTSSSRGVSVASGELLAARAGCDEDLDDPWVDDRATLGDRLDRTHKLRPVVDPLFEQVAATVRAALEKGQHMLRIVVLGENDHADLGMRFAKDGGNADAFVALRRRHANVRQHHVRALSLDRRQE